MSKEGLDSFLFGEIEEWLPTPEAILYFEMELGIKFGPILLRTLGLKHGFMRKGGTLLEYNVVPFKDKLEALFFVEPPDGYLPFPKLHKKYPYIKHYMVLQWIRAKLVEVVRIPVGTTEVTYVKESSYRELYRERTSSRRYKGMPGTERMWRKYGRIGKKRGRRKDMDRDGK